MVNRAVVGKIKLGRGIKKKPFAQQLPPVMLTSIWDSNLFL